MTPRRPISQEGPRGDGRVNGCRVRARIGDAVVIHHPTGWMVYRGWRVGTRRHLRSAIRLALRTA